ncbi:hypothetical protein SASPL_118017 [Salvia splendens]|uniref:Wall-associated receptor kinase C-terminal domain-containing protein n=1 Tax=Salvia splendens TaxID=180675 RepID=A0A8X8XYY8_SALSN|nr:hypothetical protein SASPL_118017 [Salvia splendens]
MQLRWLHCSSVTRLISSFTCTGSAVTVWVTQTAATSLGSNLSPDSSAELLRTSIRGGFSIQWSADNQNCQRCLDSGGACSSDGSRSFSRESDGNTSLYSCTFSDSTSSASDDYTTFVKSYARLLDEALDTHAFISTNGDNADKLTSTIEVMPQVQSLIDHAIGCWAVGAASRSFLVRSAMKHVICDSICWYAAEMDKVLENLIRMPYRSCVEGGRAGGGALEIS